MPRVVVRNENARKLHPRLRVVKNGDRNVNAVRSSGSTTVVCTSRAKPSKAAAAAPLLAAQAIQPLVYMAQAQACRLAAGAPKARPLPKRRKLAQQPTADDCFVNVLVEFYQEAPGATAGKHLAEISRIEAELRSALAQADARTLRGAVLKRRNFLAATVPVSSLADLQKASVAFVHRSEPLKLEVPVAARASEPVSKAVKGADLHKNGQGVMIGIIDVGGFDFAHSDFLDAKGNTRFETIWDQGGDFRNPPSKYGSDFGYGAEFTREHLNAAIAAAKEPGLPPASMIERQSQLEPGSHGTHVASIAAGKTGVCPAAKIAAVLIDVPLPDDPVERRRATFSDTSRIIHAVEYLLAVAREHNSPIVINISLGTNGGAHDGSSGVSRWLDAYLASPGRAICVAAGNAGQEAAEEEGDLGWIMGRIHASGCIPSRDLEAELEWTVVGDGIEDVSENEMEIWYGAQDRLEVELKPPGASSWIRVKPREFVENLRLQSGTTVSIYNELYHPTNGANYIAIYLSPNLDENNFRGIQAGAWRVRLRGEEIRDGNFHAWIERDDPVEIDQVGNRRLFRFPSFFSAASNVDSHSISSLACGHRVIAVANLDDARQRINISSSQGPTRDGRWKPEVAAPGTDIVAANGFSSPDDPWLAMTGTSMASPYVAGVLGLMLAAKPRLTAAQCLGILQRTSKPLPGTSYAWSNAAGYGRIDAEAAVQEAGIINQRIDIAP